MIQIQVVEHKGVPPQQPLSVEFDELGGNIGRAEGNALVLHDPERHISRIHAAIIFRGGKYFIRSLGSASPVYLNDQPLSNGQDESIRFGDNIRIDSYMLQVVNKEALEPRDCRPGTEQERNPFGLFDDHADNNSLSDLLAPSPVDDSLKNIATPKDIIPNSQFVSNPDPSSNNTAQEFLGIIPPDFDPFAENSSPSDVLNSGLESPASEQNIDNIITPHNPLVEMPDKSNADSIDPMILIGGVSDKKVGASKPDNVPEIQASFPQPKVKDAASRVSSAISPRKKIVDESVVAKSAVKHDELMRAFLNGAGMPDLDMPSELTPELMGLIGELLRESTQGTLDLLTARTLTKREMRAEMTMIAPRENNPLKFSPNVDAALTHLLAPKGRGFLVPQAAMKDAYDDLRSHQFGFMAGMRAALTGVLECFNPKKLEQRLMHKTLMDTLFQKNHKAKLWDLFTERYSDISNEAEEDFHALFGREFLRAYEAQVVKLEQDDKRI